MFCIESQARKESQGAEEKKERAAALAQGVEEFSLEDKG